MFLRFRLLHTQPLSIWVKYQAIPVVKIDASHCTDIASLTKYAKKELTPMFDAYSYAQITVHEDRKGAPFKGDQSLQSIGAGREPDKPLYLKTAKPDLIDLILASNEDNEVKAGLIRNNQEAALTRFEKELHALKISEAEKVKNLLTIEKLRLKVVDANIAIGR
jgi:hypothetical protein